MHAYRARGAIIEWERTNPSSAPPPPPPPPPAPAEWGVLSRTHNRALHWWASPSEAPPPPPPPPPPPSAPASWEVLSRTHARTLHWFARPEGSTPPPAPTPAPAPVGGGSAGGGYSGGIEPLRTIRERAAPKPRPLTQDEEILAVLQALYDSGIFES